MPRMNNPPPTHQLAKLLLLGDGKCGKTDFAAMAGADGFNILYLDADVGAQTIAGLPESAKENIYLMSVGDRYSDSGGIEPFFAQFFKDFVNANTLVWNDSKSRKYTILRDGQSNPDDEFWLVKPYLMDHNCILVVDSWTSLSQSCMQWAANEYGVDLGEVGDDRKDMRKIYQAAGEKLTQFLLAIKNSPCHVIVLGHPAEFVKTKKPDGKTIGATQEKDLRVLWTKMVPKSSSNNHAFSMASYFTDVAWIEAKLLGKRVIDFRVDNEKISGGHFNEVFDLGDRDKGTKGFTFADLVRKIGGTIPGIASPVEPWLCVQRGYESGTAKPVALSSTAGSRVDVPNVNAGAIPSTPKPTGVLNLAGVTSRAPATP